MTTQLRKSGISSVWVPACQDVTPGGHTRVGVVSLHGALLSFPTLATPAFTEFFRLGRAMNVVLPLSSAGVPICL